MKEKTIASVLYAVIDDSFAAVRRYAVRLGREDKFSVTGMLACTGFVLWDGGNQE